MLAWPPGFPGPSAPAKCFTIDGISGMRLSTGGRTPDFTCSAKAGVSCRADLARARTGASTASVTPAVKSRRFMGRLLLSFIAGTLRHDAGYIKAESPLHQRTAGLIFTRYAPGSAARSP